MKPFRPTTSEGKAALVKWLRDNDKQTLEAIKDTALIFGPIESISYLPHDDTEARKMFSWLKEQQRRLINEQAQ